MGLALKKNKGFKSHLKVVQKPLKIQYKCPHCQGVGFSQGEDVSCYHCAKKIEIKTIHLAKVHCSNCFDGYDINIINGFKETKCRSCKGIVDLFYNNKKGYFISGQRR